MPYNNIEQEIMEEAKKVAQDICDLTGFGMALHPNDILPEIKALGMRALRTAIHRYEEEVRVEKKILRLVETERERINVGYNLALSALEEKRREFWK